VVSEVIMSLQQGLRNSFLIVGLISLGGASPVSAREAYYMLLFSSQRTVLQPNHTHSFATFVRISCNGPQPGIPVMEAHTISWLPVNGRVHVLAVFPEQGCNRDLQTTLRLVMADEQHVSMWGPYEIDSQIYFSACQQQSLLESGQVRYKAIDSLRFSDRVSNCVHAISGVIDGQRFRVFSVTCGEPAGALLIRRFSPWIINPSYVYPSVASALGVDSYPLIHRYF
jgi:hypothetical protein